MRHFISALSLCVCLLILGGCGDNTQPQPNQNTPQPTGQPGAAKKKPGQGTTIPTGVGEYLDAVGNAKRKTEKRLDGIQQIQKDRAKEFEDQFGRPKGPQNVDEKK